MINLIRHIFYLCLIVAPFSLTSCSGGTSGGGTSTGDLSSLASTVFGTAVLQSTEAIQVKQTLNQLSMKLSILASSSPSQLQSITRAQAIASALQGIANTLVGVMPRNVDVQKFSQVANIIGPQYWQMAFVPVVTCQMIQFQAAYLNLLLQYMATALNQMRDEDIKNLLAVLQTCVQSLAGVAV